MNEPERPPVLARELVRGVQTRERVEEDAQANLGREPRSAGLRCSEEAAERAAFDVLHGHEDAARALVDVEDLHHVGVADHHGELGLFDELERFAPPVREVLRQELERHFALEAAHAARSRQVDDAHPAARDREQDFVAPEPLRKTCGHLLPFAHMAHRGAPG